MSYYLHSSFVTLIINYSYYRCAFVQVYFVAHSYAYRCIQIVQELSNARLIATSFKFLPVHIEAGLDLANDLDVMFGKIKIQFYDAAL